MNKNRLCVNKGKITDEQKWLQYIKGPIIPYLYVLIYRNVNCMFLYFKYVMLFFRRSTASYMYVNEAKRQRGS